MKQVTELNKAIYTVLTTQFKKDAPGAFKTVELAGYEVSKTNGHFTVYNTDTHRSVHIRYHYIYYGYYENRRKEARTLEQALTFDFTAYLNKALNKAYNEPFYVEDKPTLVKYNSLKSVRNTVEWRTRDIEKKLEQIERLQRELIKDVEYKQNAIARLKDVRKELGLIR